MKKSLKIVLLILTVALLFVGVIFTYSVGAEEGTEVQYNISNIVFMTSEGDPIDITGDGDIVDDILGGLEYTLAEAVALVPEDCMIVLAKPMVVDAREMAGLIEVNKQFTIFFPDEDQIASFGLTEIPELTFIQNGEGTAGFDITSSDAAVTLMGGKVNVIDVSGEPGSYPLFTSSNGSDINLVLNATHTYMGSLAYSESANVYVRISAGEYHIPYPPKGTKTDSAWIECGGNAGIDVENAFILSYADTSAFSFVVGNEKLGSVSMDTDNSVFAAADSTVNVFSNVHEGVSVNLGENTVVSAALAPNVIGTLPDGVYPIKIASGVVLADTFDLGGMDMGDVATQEQMVSLINQLFAHLSIDPKVIEKKLYLEDVGIENVPGVILPEAVSITTDYRIGPKIMDTPNTYSFGFEILVAADPASQGFVTQYAEVSRDSYINFAPLAIVDVYNNDGELVESIEGTVGEYIYRQYDWMVDEFCEPNGWYMWRNTGAWINHNGYRYDGMLVIEGTSSYYPEKEVKAHMTELTWNMSLGTYFTINIGIPMDIPDNIMITGVNGKNMTPQTGYTESGEPYYSYPVRDVYPVKIDETFSTSITLYVDLGNYTASSYGYAVVTQNVKNLSGYKYIQKILADSDAQDPQFTHEVHVMMADLMRYCVVAANASTFHSLVPEWARYDYYVRDENGDLVYEEGKNYPMTKDYYAGAYNEAKALVDEELGYDYRHLLSDLGDDVLLENGLIDGSADSYFGQLAAKDNAHTALAGYVEWLSYTFNKTEPRLTIWMTKGDLDPDNYGEEVVFTDVKIIIDEGWIPEGYKNEDEGYNWGRTEYVKDDTWRTSFWDYIRLGRYIKVGDYYYQIDSVSGGEISTIYPDPQEEDPQIPYRTDEIASVIPGNIPFYNLDKQWTIEITYYDYHWVNGRLGEAKTVSGTYSLASYYCSMKARWDGSSNTTNAGPGVYDEETMCTISDFVYSVYACSRSLANYRFSKQIPNPEN